MQKKYLRGFNPLRNIETKIPKQFACLGIFVFVRDEGLEPPTFAV